MEAIISNPRIRYAVIEVRRGEADCEWLVVGYNSQVSLRRVIASSRIVATDLVSREAAIAHLQFITSADHSRGGSTARLIIGWLGRCYLALVTSVLGR